MDDNTFRYNYSARRNKEVESIRKKYIPHEESKLETLKRLDRRVQRAGTVAGLCLGVIGALTFGIGMCFLLEVFSGALWMAALFMLLGTSIMIPAYPVCRHLSRKAKAELTPEILRLSAEILGS